MPDEFVDGVFDTALGGVSGAEREYWLSTYRGNYAGDAGRHRLRVNTVNLRDRDGLHGRLDEVREEIRMFTRSPKRVWRQSRAGRTS